jgi:hypothetical protein
MAGRHQAFALGGIMAGALCVARPALAEDTVGAQALFDQGKKAMAEHNYAEACPKLEESLRLQEALGTMLNLALCYEQEGRLASAWSRFLEVASRARTAGQGQRARVAQNRANALAPKLSNLVVDVPAANRVDGLEVRKDGVPVGQAEWGSAIPADAGPHTVEATAPGRKRWSGTVKVAGGAVTAHVEVPLLDPEAPPAAAPERAEARPAPVEPAPPAPVPEKPSHGNGMRIAAYVTGGVGLAGLAAGGVFGVLALLRHNDAASACPTDPCRTAAGQQLWSDATNFGNVSTVAFAAGGALFATSVVLLLTAPKASEAGASEAHLLVGPGSVSFRGAW